MKIMALYLCLFLIRTWSDYVSGKSRLLSNNLVSKVFDFGLIDLKMLWTILLTKLQYQKEIIFGIFTTKIIYKSFCNNSTFLHERPHEFPISVSHWNSKWKRLLLTVVIITFDKSYSKGASSYKKTNAESRHWKKLIRSFYIKKVHK